MAKVINALTFIELNVNFYKIVKKIKKEENEDY